MNNKTTFKKEDTGLDYDETFPYEFTLGSPICWYCRFKYNEKEVAPCSDCAGFYNTQRSYFQEFNWVEVK